jgi:hypothetical protein
MIGAASTRAILLSARTFLAVLLEFVNYEQAAISRLAPSAAINVLRS